MKTAKRWKFKSVGARMAMLLILAAMALSLDGTTASAGDNGRHDGYRDGRGDHGRDHDRGRGRHRGRRVYRPYGYVEPVYVAPPVYYAPPPPPGVSIFLPTIRIR